MLGNAIASKNTFTLEISIGSHIDMFMIAKCTCWKLILTVLSGPNGGIFLVLLQGYDDGSA